MKMSMSRSTFAAIAIVGIAVSAPGSTHTAYAAARETVTAAIAAPIAMDKTKGPHIAASMPSPSIDESALAPEHPDLDIVSVRGRRLPKRHDRIRRAAPGQGLPGGSGLHQTPLAKRTPNNRASVMVPKEPAGH